MSWKEIKFTLPQILVFLGFVIPYAVTFGIFQSQFNGMKEKIIKLEAAAEKVPIMVIEMERLKDDVEGIDELNGFTVRGIMYMDTYWKVNAAPKYKGIPIVAPAVTIGAPSVPISEAKP